MIRNFFLVSLRNFHRHKLYSIINLIGLAIGLASALLVVLFINDELSFDRSGPRSAQTYRLIWSHAGSSAGQYSVVIPMTMVSKLQSWLPGVQAVTALKHLSNTSVSYGSRVFNERRMFAADSMIFDVFNIRLLQGDRGTSLGPPNSILLSRSTAHRYFAEVNPIGRTLKIAGVKDFQITGVFDDIPPQSHFHADFLVSFASYGPMTDPWSSQGYVYLTLDEGVSPSQIENTLARYSDLGHMGWWAEGMNIQLQPLTEIHLGSHALAEIEPNADVRYMYIYSAIAILIIVIAAANYTNLALAQSVRRAREIGVRKVFGGNRAQLIRHFIGESILISSLAAPVAFLLAELALPTFDQLVQKTIAVQMLFTPVMIASALILVLAIGFVSGAYPAFYLSSLHPSEVLKTSWTIRAGRMNVRKALVVVQFTVAIAMIAGTLIIHDQLEFIRSKNVGFEKENVVSIPMAHAEIGKNFAQFKNELLKDPAIEMVSGASASPFEAPALLDRIEGAEFQVQMIDPDYVPLMRLEVITGRNFSESFGADTNACLVNQSAVAALGWRDPLGKTYPGFRGGPVVGVIKDFNNRPLRQPIQPLVFEFNRQFFREILVRIKPAQAKKAIDHMSTLWKTMAIDRPFEFTFLDQEYDQLYRTEVRLAGLSTIFSALAVFVACLGLYGLAAFLAERRKKEIAIRRVLGASVSAILFELTSEFVKTVLISELIAIPVAWYVMSRWLQDFAYRVDLGAGAFLLAGFLSLLTAVAAVSIQALRSTHAQPVDALRME